MIAAIQSRCAERHRFVTSENTMYWITIYFGICLLIGICGMNRKLGFWGYFLGALALSPIVGLILVACSDPRKDI